MENIALFAELAIVLFGWALTLPAFVKLGTLVFR